MLTMIFRTMLLYALLIVVVRLLGKRQLGQMEPSEFVVTMLLANLATIPLEEPSTPVMHGIAPIALVFAAEYLTAYLTLRSIFVRRLFCGKPVILIENGKISAKNLRRTRINLDELTMHLREKEIFDLSEVKFAILETNGQLSTMMFSKNMPASAEEAGIPVHETELPITLISDGKLLQDNLDLTDKSEQWVQSELEKRNCTQKQTLLLTVDADDRIYFVKREDMC